jgi:hypothetical protein
MRTGTGRGREQNPWGSALFRLREIFLLQITKSNFSVRQAKPGKGEWVT